MKQDIIPPHLVPRGTLRPPIRASTAPMVNRPVSPRPVATAITAAAVSTASTASTGARQQHTSGQTAAAAAASRLMQSNDLIAPVKKRATPVGNGVNPVKAEPFPESPRPDMLNDSFPVVIRRPDAMPSFAHRLRGMKLHGLTVLAVAILGVTGYVTYDTWLTNRSVEAAQKETSSQLTGAEATGGAAQTPENEGTDKTPVTTNMLSSYSVSPEYPRALYIKKLNVSARVLPMSVNKDGSIQAPVNVFDAGWYTGSVKPGEIGASFIDGHASGATRMGLFAYLDTLVEGDRLEIEKGDGTRLTYEVVHTEKVPRADLDMKKILLPYGTTLRGLNIMTCTGTWVEKDKTYDQRAVVYTRLVE